MRLLHGVGAGLLGGLCAVALGCGSSGASLLGSEQASGLKDTLAEVRAAVDERSCSKASARLTQLKSEVGNLGGQVDRELRVRLREEINDKLGPAVTKECDDPVTETTPTVTETTPTGPTGPTETGTDTTPTTPTTDTDTTPPQTDTSETIPETPTIPDPTTDTTPTVPDPTQDPGGISPDDLEP